MSKVDFHGGRRNGSLCTSCLHTILWWDYLLRWKTEQSHYIWSSRMPQRKVWPLGPHGSGCSECQKSGFSPLVLILWVSLPPGLPGMSKCEHPGVSQPQSLSPLYSHQTQMERKQVSTFFMEGQQLALPKDCQPVFWDKTRDRYQQVWWEVQQ